MLTWFAGMSGLAKAGIGAGLLVAMIAGIFAAGVATEKLMGDSRDANYSSSAADAQRDVYDDRARGVRSPYAAD
jgi:hypothetical protein